MNKRIKKKKSHPLLNPVAVAYIDHINKTCIDVESDTDVCFYFINV